MQRRLFHKDEPKLGPLEEGERHVDFGYLSESVISCLADIVTAVVQRHRVDLLSCPLFVEALPHQL